MGISGGAQGLHSSLLNYVETRLCLIYLSCTIYPLKSPLLNENKHMDMLAFGFYFFFQTPHFPPPPPPVQLDKINVLSVNSWLVWWLSVCSYLQDWQLVLCLIVYVSARLAVGFVSQCVSARLPVGFVSQCMCIQDYKWVLCLSVCVCKTASCFCV